MSFHERQFATASPVLTMTPQSSHQSPFGTPGLVSQHAQSSFPGSLPTPSEPPPSSRPAASAGRKRSRDEASANLEPDPVPALPTPESETNWTFGEGMTLIKDDASYVADAGNQSGTWLEEKAEKDVQETTARLLEAQTLETRNVKLQRVEPCGANVSASQDAGLSPADAATQGPVVDDFTLHLGIGWRKLSEDKDIQSAARGWARYIENHYPVTNATIRLESRGLQSYLVEAVEGFFLFAEDLRHGRLVSNTVDGALRNLQSSPPVFDSPDEMSAAQSPQPTTTTPEDATVADAGMEMD